MWCDIDINGKRIRIFNNHLQTTEVSSNKRTLERNLKRQYHRNRTCHPQTHRRTGRELRETCRPSRAYAQADNRLPPPHTGVWRLQLPALVIYLPHHERQPSERWLPNLRPRLHVHLPLFQETAQNRLYLPQRGAGRTGLLLSGAGLQRSQSGGNADEDQVNGKDIPTPYK